MTTTPTAPLTLEAAPEHSSGAFPARILSLLRFVAERNPPDGKAPYEDEHGEPMQDDAEAAIRWISEAQSAQAAAPEIAAIREALNAGATSAWLTHPRDSNQWHANEMLALACSSENLHSVLATIAQLEARLREAEERLRRSQDAGLMLSNFAFNMAHREGRTLSADDCASLKLMYERWDAAIAAHGKDEA